MSEEQDKTIDFNLSTDEQAAQAIEDADILKALVENLSGGSRRVRQFSAAALDSISLEHASLLAPYIDDLVDALYRPESQTRWQSLEALEYLVPIDLDGAGRACDGAESCLYDESAGIVRLHAFKFFTAYAAADAACAEKVWPFIDEAIQCYHGDPEFPEMLSALIVLAGATTSEPVRKAIIDRMSFDANSGRGGLKHRAAQIIEAANANR